MRKCAWGGSLCVCVGGGGSPASQHAQLPVEWDDNRQYMETGCDSVSGGLGNSLASRRPQRVWEGRALLGLRERGPLLGPPENKNPIKQTNAWCGRVGTLRTCATSTARGGGGGSSRDAPGLGWQGQLGQWSPSLPAPR